MIPILLSANSKVIGTLHDCTRSYVTQERNGMSEAEFDYPIKSAFFEKIQTGCFILAKPDDTSDNQKFRIYKISKPIMGQVTISCEHVRYQLNGMPIAKGTYSGTPASILDTLLANTGFTAWSDIDTVKDIKTNIPVTVGAMLAGKQGSLLDTFGGEYEFDNYTVKLHQNRGQEKSVEIRYRKNLTEFTCTIDTTSTYTSVYPFYYNETDNIYVELPTKTIPLANNLSFDRCYMLDLSAEFEDTPTVQELQAKANAFIKANDLDSISYHYKISFVPLWQTEEYKNLAVLERCGLCDIVRIIHDGLNESVKAKIIKTVYDVLNERYVSMELGSATSNFAHAVQQSVRRLTDNIQSTKSFLQASIERQTKLITGNHGGYVVMRDSNEDGYPDEQLIMDNLSIGAAQRLWRWNLGGLGYSSHGYAGPFTVALTMAGEINASMITTGSLDAGIIRTGELDADLIKVGTIQDRQNNMSINMQTGKINMTVGSRNALEMWTQGLTMYSSTREVLTSMFVSNNDRGVVTANKMFVGVRDNERIILSADSTSGYIRCNQLYADTLQVNTSGQTLSVWGDFAVSGTITTNYSHSNKFSLVKSNNTYTDVLQVVNDGQTEKTSLSCDTAAVDDLRIRKLNVFNMLSNTYQEFEKKIIYVQNADTGNMELMQVLAVKE